MFKTLTQILTYKNENEWERKRERERENYYFNINSPLSMQLKSIFLFLRVHEWSSLKLYNRKCSSAFCCYLNSKVINYFTVTNFHNIIITPLHPTRQAVSHSHSHQFTLKIYAFERKQQQQQAI